MLYFHHQLFLSLCLPNPHSTGSTAVCLETPPIVFVVSFWFIEATTTCQQFFQIWQTIGLSRAIPLWPRQDFLDSKSSRWGIYGMQPGYLFLVEYQSKKELSATKTRTCWHVASRPYSLDFFGVFSVACCFGVGHFGVGDAPVVSQLCPVSSKGFRRLTPKVVWYDD